jgi:ABC-type cobalt transport system substrate-binding protein
MRSAAQRKRWIGGFIAIVACLALDFFPSDGPPQFRYAGSDPSEPVWNFGWPLATVMWDPAQGLQIGPFAYLLFSLQLLIGVAVITIIAIRDIARARVAPQRLNT